MVQKLYTVREAQAVLDGLRPIIEDVITVRADTAELGAALQRGVNSPLGGLPELKAYQAHLDELLSQVTAEELQVKGIAPLLLDFPAELDGEQVLLCWLEGDTELAWYHRLDAGFAGRRRLPADA
ncbi:MAG: DUF2203 family protein [Streptosporangiales bacterium]|nr:DUF2203 family protein [Streptosporangiales bacterium]